MFRCPVCQPPFIQSGHQSYFPYASSSSFSPFSSVKKPTKGEDFINNVSSASSSTSFGDHSKPSARTSNLRASPFFSTPPSSPSDMKAKVEEDATMAGHKRQSTSHMSDVDTAVGARAARARERETASARTPGFSSRAVPSQPMPSMGLHSGSKSFDHSSLVEVISSLQEENRRLSGMLLKVIKEKEDLVSRHEEESFRMVDDFEREKEELNKSFKEPSMKNKTKATTGGTTDKSISVTLLCIEGPHLGESTEVNGILIIGSAPSDSTKGSSSNLYSIWKDRKASRNHAKLVLNKSGSKSKQVLMIKVYDLMSDHGTKVNNKLIPKGSSRQAFIKDKIQIGQSVFRISKTV